MNSNLLHIVLLLILAFITTLLTSCRVQRDVQPVVLHDKAFKSDSVAINFSDTILLRINEISGDTAYIERTRWRTVYKERIDTLYTEVPVVVTELKPYVPEWVMYLALAAGAVLLIAAGRVAFWIYRKFVLHI